MLFNKAIITERNYMSHSAEECFGKRYNHNSIRDGLVVHMEGRAEAVKQWKKSENK